jgi:hypothetical protein
MTTNSIASTTSTTPALATGGAPVDTDATSAIENQRAQNEQTAQMVQQMQAENIRFQMLSQVRANAFESRKEAIRSTRAN